MASGRDGVLGQPDITSAQTGSLVLRAATP